MRTLTVADWSTVASVSFPTGATGLGHLGVGDVVTSSTPTITAGNLIYKNAAGNPLTGMGGSPTYLWSVVSAQGYGENGTVGGNARNSFAVVDADKASVGIPGITVATSALSNANITKYVVGLQLKVTAGGKTLTSTAPLEVTLGPDLTDVVSIAFPNTVLTQTATNTYTSGAEAEPEGLSLPQVTDLIILNNAGKNIANALPLDTLTYTWSQGTLGASLLGSDVTAAGVTPSFAWDTNGKVTADFPLLTMPSLKFTSAGASGVFGTDLDAIIVPMNLSVSDATPTTKATTVPIVITFPAGV